MLTLESVRAIAEELIPQLPQFTPDEPHCIRVHHGDMQQHRIIGIYWDSLAERNDHRFAFRGTAVDIADTEEMVRYRIRAMFANDAHLKYTGRYENSTIEFADHPNEPPPYEVHPA